MGLVGCNEPVKGETDRAGAVLVGNMPVGYLSSRQKGMQDPITVGRSPVACLQMDGCSHDNWYCRAPTDMYTIEGRQTMCWRSLLIYNRILWILALPSVMSIYLSIYLHGIIQCG